MGTFYFKKNCHKYIKWNMMYYTLQINSEKVHLHFNYLSPENVYSIIKKADL